MAARTRKVQHDERTKTKIQASQLINRLEAYIDTDFDNEGVMKDAKGVRLQPSQVTAALGLIKKVVPDLAAVQHTGIEGGPVVFKVIGQDSKLV